MSAIGRKMKRGRDKKWKWDWVSVKGEKAYQDGVGVIRADDKVDLESFSRGPVASSEYTEAKGDYLQISFVQEGFMIAGKL